jgi:hypothetical protein
VAFNVFFEIKRKGVAVSGGILVYETTTDTQRSRRLYSDTLDQYGMVNTNWHSDWAGEAIEVYCHTDGINKGTPAYVGRVILKSGARYELSTR